VLGRTGSLTDGTQGKALLAVMSPLFTPTILRYFIVVPKLLTIFEEPAICFKKRERDSEYPSKVLGVRAFDFLELTQADHPVSASLF